MCGIFGSFQQGIKADEWQQLLSLGNEGLAHRGPDDAGVWFDAEAGIGFAHRRLSILDLSSAGHQPMHSPSGRFCIVYNGEIYNYVSMMDALREKGYIFKGNSDTEVLLAGFEAWGIEETVQRCNGMFAIALWDAKEKVLYLIRDRLGIKPLYYGQVGNQFIFGSELKSIRANPGLELQINPLALDTMLRRGYVPEPMSIYSGIKKLKPGTILKISRDRDQYQEVMTTYWSLHGIEQTEHAPIYTSQRESMLYLEALFMDAVKLRMISDVPLGAFLSGGVDSSLVVAMMQLHHGDAVKTFSIGFEDERYDEAVYARDVAKHLGTDHHELYVSAQQAMDWVPNLAGFYDEPFGDSSALPTLILSQMTREHVTVSLSGDGGDELFAGYKRYHLVADMLRTTGWLPGGIRSMGSQMMQAIPAGIFDFLAAPLAPIFRRYARDGRASDKLYKFAALLDYESGKDLYRHMMQVFPDSASLLSDTFVSHGEDPLSIFDDASGIYQQMMGYDLLTYLPDNILVKLDRASMAFSLEGRVPFLDHHFVEFAVHLPLHYKMQGGTSKWMLKQILAKYIPVDMVNRPKMGFGIPLGDWLRGPLKTWGADLLGEKKLLDAGYLDANIVLKRWHEHQIGARDWTYSLWNVLMFQAWLDE